MAKDAKGHGSEKRSGSDFVQGLQPMTPDQQVAKLVAGHPGIVSDADAAKALAGGGAKSEPVPVHSGAAGAQSWNQNPPEVVARFARERAEAKQFAGAKAEINRLKRQGQ